MNEPLKLLVGTPAYSGLMHTSYVRSLLDLASLGIPFSLYAISNESLVMRGRNTILAYFHANSQFSHLLFLDADVGIRGTDVRKLLDYGTDVIAAPVNMKVPAGTDARFSVGEVLDRAGTLAKVTQVATAVMILSRRATSALVADAISRGETYVADTSGQEGDAGGEHYDVFRVGVIEGRYYGEDFWACRTLRRLGFDIHVDLAVRVQHFGMHDFGR